MVAVTTRASPVPRCLGLPHTTSLVVAPALANEDFPIGQGREDFPKAGADEDLSKHRAHEDF